MTQIAKNNKGEGHNATSRISMNNVEIVWRVGLGVIIARNRFGIIIENCGKCLHAKETLCSKGGCQRIVYGMYFCVSSLRSIEWFIFIID